jgi:hypothetical protein
MENFNPKLIVGFNYFIDNKKGLKMYQKEWEPEIKRLRAKKFAEAPDILILKFLTLNKNSEDAKIFRETLKTDMELQKRTAKVKKDLYLF